MTITTTEENRAMNTNVICETYCGDGSEFRLIATAGSYYATRDGAVVDRYRPSRGAYPALTSPTAWFDSIVRTVRIPAIPDTRSG